MSSSLYVCEQYICKQLILADCGCFAQALNFNYHISMATQFNIQNSTSNAFYISTIVISTYIIFYSTNLNRCQLNLFSNMGLDWQYQLIYLFWPRWREKSMQNAVSNEEKLNLPEFCFIRLKNIYHLSFCALYPRNKHMYQD